MKFTKISAGWYATPDGRYAVVIDGLPYVTIAEREGQGINAGITGGEWSANFDSSGRLREDNNVGIKIGWSDTKRDAIDFCQSHSAKDKI